MGYLEDLSACDCYESGVRLSYQVGIDRRGKLVPAAWIWDLSFSFLPNTMEVLVLLIRDLLSTSTSDFAGNYFKKLCEQKHGIPASLY